MLRYRVHTAIDDDVVVTPVPIFVTNSLDLASAAARGASAGMGRLVMLVDRDERTVGRYRDGEVIAWDVLR